MTLPHVFQKSTSGESLYYTWFSAMHTRVDLIFISREAESFYINLTNLIHKRILEIEQIGNCFNPETEISEVNRSAYFRQVEISDEFYRILHACLKYHSKTCGLFDITTDSKNFSSATMTQLRLSENKQISFARPDIYLNLSGFLKGYALEEIRPILKNSGIRNALINMGNSSVLALGHQMGHQGWAVRLQNENEDVILNDECLTTSGNPTVQQLHIVNPLSGKFATGKRSLSVVNTNGIEGEVLSTALFLADKLQREKIAHEFQIKRTIYSPFHPTHSNQTVCKQAIS